MSIEPGVVIPLALGAAWYARGAVQLRRVSTRSRARLRRRGMLFWAGMATLLVALVGPMDELSDALFSAHMAQHLLLIMVAAPLVVLSAPAPALWWGMPRPARLAAARAWQRKPVLHRAWRMLSSAGVAFPLHVAALWFWHFPGPYQAALENPALHALEHLSFFGTALLFWWVVLQPTGHRRLSYPAAIVVTGATMVQSGALGAFLMYATRPWYPAHAAGVQSWGMTLMDDQRLAGLVMWIPAGVVYISAAVWLMWRWLSSDEAANARAAAVTRRPTTAHPVLLGVLVLGVIGGMNACTRSSGGERRVFVEGGDAARGREALARYGCGTCHMIPGVERADGLVGPPLIHWQRRRIIAGEIPNDPERLVTWIEMPQAVEPGTDMPNMGVTEGVAKDMAAYLYTLR